MSATTLIPVLLLLAPFLLSVVKTFGTDGIVD